MEHPALGIKSGLIHHIHSLLEFLVCAIPVLKARDWYEWDSHVEWRLGESLPRLNQLRKALGGGSNSGNGFWMPLKLWNHRDGEEF